MSEPRRIRPARPEDVSLLPAIEWAAAQQFRAVGIDGAFLDSVKPVAAHLAAQAEGRLLVAEGDDGLPIGFALVEWLDGTPHLEEIDVHPEHGRRGAGRALVAAVLAWAATRGAAAVTLSTFRDVPWNAPFYARLGFAPLAEDALGPGLRGVVAAERAQGLDMDRRVVMRRSISP
jgi:GNAT superfamily N-acetyltransferase